LDKADSPHRHREHGDDNNAVKQKEAEEAEERQLIKPSDEFVDGQSY
jgi:hypothetical protein